MSLRVVSSRFNFELDGIVVEQANVDNLAEVRIIFGRNLNIGRHLASQLAV